MSNARYNQIIDEVYETYLKGGDIKWLKQVDVSSTPLVSMVIPIPYSKNEFINKIKTDQEFSEKWGLKVEERELSLEERMQIWNERIKGLFIMLIWGHDKTQEESLNEHNIPNKLITLTYQDEKIEVYD
jgi:hypothetical protein